MLKALLVDDEINNLTSLEFMLKHDCEGIAVVGRAQSSGEARAWLQRHEVDVVFLDIHMPVENGFQLLSSLTVRDFKVVFVTAYNEFALQAIKASAVDYILKPISITELQVAVEKVKAACANPAMAGQQQQLIRHLLEIATRQQAPRKIALPQLGGISFIEVDDIVSLQADGNYTIIHLKNMQKLVISKTLRDFEELLDGDQFARIHKSYIVHLRYVVAYSSVDGGVVRMCDGNQWSISRRQLDAFLEKIRKASLIFGK